MRYTQTKDYIKYIECLTSGDIDSALESLKRCVNDPAVQEDAVEHADLLQRIGVLLFEKGNTEEAIEYFEQSEKTDPTSLLMLYYHAKFMVEKLGKTQKAIEKCDIIIERAIAHPFSESGDDFSSEHYIKMATALKEECLSKCGRNTS